MVLSLPFVVYLIVYSFPAQETQIPNGSLAVIKEKKMKKGMQIFFTKEQLTKSYCRTVANIDGL